MTTAPIRSDWAAQTIDGKYPLRQWLGGSDQNGVFLTEFPGQPEQKAALKLIPVDDSSAQEKMETWAVVKTLSYPNLMRLLDYGLCEIGTAKLLYLVTDFAGENLAEILPERPLTPDETRDMLGPVLDALEFLHSKGLAHGRLKPSNIMVVQDQLKLSCDGISRAGQYSAVADMWSLGITLVEALTQHTPVLERPIGGGPIVPESVPQPFFDIAKGCLRAEPPRRWTIKDVRARLAGAMVEEKAHVEVAAAQPTAAPNRKLGLAWAIGAVILLVLVGLLLRFLGVGQGDNSSRKASGGGGLSDTSPSASIRKPSPIKGRTAGSERPEQPEQPERAASNPSQGSSDDSAVLQRSVPEILPAAQASIHGEFDVKVRVTVGANGAVSEAVFDSEGPSRYFGRQALEASRHWRFKPAKMSGENVQSVWLLEYHFTESGVEITPTQISP